VLRAPATFRPGQLEREVLYGRARLCGLPVIATFAEGPGRDSRWCHYLPEPPISSGLTTARSPIGRALARLLLFALGILGHACLSPSMTMFPARDSAFGWRSRSA
jgi:hypothetical protein